MNASFYLGEIFGGIAANALWTLPLRLRQEGVEKFIPEALGVAPERRTEEPTTLWGRVNRNEYLKTAGTILVAAAAAYVFKSLDNPETALESTLNLHHSASALALSGIINAGLMAWQVGKIAANNFLAISQQSSMIRNNQLQLQRNIAIASTKEAELLQDLKTELTNKLSTPAEKEALAQAWPSLHIYLMQAYQKPIQVNALLEVFKDVHQDTKLVLAWAVCESLTSIETMKKWREVEFYAASRSEDQEHASKMPATSWWTYARGLAVPVALTTLTVGALAGCMLSYSQAILPPWTQAAKTLFQITTEQPTTPLAATCLHGMATGSRTILEWATKAYAGVLIAGCGLTALKAAHAGFQVVKTYWNEDDEGHQEATHQFKKQGSALLTSLALTALVASDQDLLPSEVSFLPKVVNRNISFNNLVWMGCLGLSATKLGMAGYTKARADNEKDPVEKARLEREVVGWWSSFEFDWKVFNLNRFVGMLRYQAQALGKVLDVAANGTHFGWSQALQMHRLGFDRLKYYEVPANTTQCPAKDQIENAKILVNQMGNNTKLSRQYHELSKNFHSDKGLNKDCEALAADAQSGLNGAWEIYRKS